MSYELDEIKKIRKNLGLTQTQLAKRANVSQSLIAKIEAKRLDPTYSNVTKIFDTLSLLEKKEETKAEEIMNTKIISIKPTETLKSAVEKMKKYGISQLIVMEDGKPMGYVSESNLISAILDDHQNQVENIMEELPPVISKTTSIHVISSLLKHYPIVLISKSGKVNGLITKADLLTKLYTKG